MIMQYPTVGSATLTGGVTTVDCQKQVRSWRLLRSLIELLIPTCNCTFIEENEEKYWQPIPMMSSAAAPTTATVTGTIFGCRRGKVRFCIQSNPKSTTPILLLELAIPTTTLAREMKGGLIRIALECSGSGSGGLLSMPVWNMYCNGRKAGFAVKRRPSKTEIEVLQKMESVVVGAGK